MLLAARNGSSRKALCFATVLSFFFSSRDLQGPWADLREILPRGRKHVQFTNAGPKIQGPAPQKYFWGEKHDKVGPISDPFPFELKYFRNG